MSLNDKKINITEQFESFFPEFIRELKNVYSNLSDAELRENLVSPINTEFLFNNIRSNTYFESKYMHLYGNPNPTTKKFNLYTLSGPEDEEQKYVVFEVNRSGIGIYFKQYDPVMYPGLEEFVDDGIEDLNSNNIGLSWDNVDKWYIYGVKTNDKGVFIPGNLAQKYAFEIAKACKLQKFFIHDAAVVNCKFGVSEEKDIQDKNDIEHFSLARILNGKPGFYEYPPIVNYYELQRAQAAKLHLSEYYKKLDDREKKILKDFVNCAKIYCSDIPITQCAELNKILKTAHEDLIANGFASSRRDQKATVLEELIYDGSMFVGGKHKKVKKTIKKKKTKIKRSKNSKKTIKKKKTKKVKKTKKSR